MLFKVSRYAEILNSIITSLFEVLGNTRIELNHPAFMQRLWKKKRRLAVPCPGCVLDEPSIRPNDTKASASQASIFLI
jgi:hypothetical protein